MGKTYYLKTYTGTNTPTCIWPSLDSLHKRATSTVSVKHRTKAKKLLEKRAMERLRERFGRNRDVWVGR